MATITAAMIKELRDATGAGMLDCKNALAENDGDFEKATDALRTKGLAGAAKKEGRTVQEGMIGAYIHSGAKKACLVEVNCETDFVARTDQFQELARDLAMHIVAENPQYVRREDVPEAAVEREKNIYRDQMRNEGKPEQIIDRIITGKLDKYYGETCLLEQTFIKDPDVTIADLIKQNIATLGENIVVNRFSRFSIGD
jgi:elongation factor Ts